jgi:catechol 2,3-dioxygenase-like lactoylglutathione lyase family enzyme
MTIQRMEHVGIVVDDLEAATAFFVELGLKLQGEGQVEGGWVDRVVGLEGVRVEYAMVETPDGHGSVFSHQLGSVEVSSDGRKLSQNLRAHCLAGASRRTAAMLVLAVVDDSLFDAELPFGR